MTYENMITTISLIAFLFIISYTFRPAHVECIQNHESSIAILKDRLRGTATDDLRKWTDDYSSAEYTIISLAVEAELAARSVAKVEAMIADCKKMASDHIVENKTNRFLDTPITEQDNSK